MGRYVGVCMLHTLRVCANGLAELAEKERVEAKKAREQAKRLKNAEGAA